VDSEGEYSALSGTRSEKNKLKQTNASDRYRRSIVTKSLSPAIFEILGIKHIGVTTLTIVALALNVLSL